MNLVNKAKSNKANGGKKTWTLVEILTCLFLKGEEGYSTADIVRIVGHSKNSITYKLGRWMTEHEISSQEDIYAHFKVEYQGEEQMLADIEAFIAERNSAAPAEEVSEAS